MKDSDGDELMPHSSCMTLSTAFVYYVNRFVAGREESDPNDKHLDEHGAY